MNITQILEITLYTLLFLLLIVGGCGIAGVTFGGVLQWSNRRGSKMRANPDPVSHGSEKTSTVPQSALNEPLVASGERKRVALLHISLWVPDQVLEEQSAEQTMECFNAFQHIGRKIAEDLNGMFERNAAHAITLYWPCEPPANVEAGQVPRAAFEMRREISRWNQSRKTDGSKPLSLVMGGDWCLGLVSPRIGMVFAGDAMMRAIQLAHRASSFGVDVLLTEDLNTVVSSDFMSDRIAEANLGAQNARIGCFRLLGYRDTEGNEIQVTSPLLAVSQPETAPHDPAIVVDEDSLLVEAPVKNWMVNTGSHIAGPYAPREIAHLLFSQDLDFDCECWQETKGKRASIAQSGMFGGPAEEEGSKFWVFDGDSLHGPLTEGFLKTAMGHGAFPPSSMICELSTLNGWKPFEAALKKTA